MFKCKVNHFFKNLPQQFYLKSGILKSHTIQRTLTNFERGILTAWLTSFLAGLDLAQQVNLLLIKHSQSS